MACPFSQEGNVGLQQVAAAAGLPVSVDQVKTHLGIESAEWDAMLLGFIAAATAHTQNFVGKAIAAQTWLLGLPGFADEIELPMGPVTAIDSIKYLDSDRVLQELTEDHWIVDLVSSPARLVRDPDVSWPDTADVPNAVSITFTTGYSSAPAPVVQAILMTVGSWWISREGGAFPAVATELLRPYRRIVI